MGWLAEPKVLRKAAVIAIVYLALALLVVLVVPGPWGALLMLPFGVAVAVWWSQNVWGWGRKADPSKPDQPK